MEKTTPQDYQQAVLKLLDTTKEEVYNPTRTRSMVWELGAVAATIKILNLPGHSYYMDKLWEAGRVDLSLEAHLWKNQQYHHLFDPETINLAKEILTAHDYFK